jgi:hypothetical protein
MQYLGGVARQATCQAMGVSPLLKYKTGPGIAAVGGHAAFGCTRLTRD